MYVSLSCWPRVLGLIALCGLTVAEAAGGEADASAPRSSAVTIRRDEWGVAHVHGKTHADAAFGMGYVQAEDYFWQIEEVYLRAIGRHAEMVGEAKHFQFWPVLEHDDKAIFTQHEQLAVSNTHVSK